MEDEGRAPGSSDFGTLLRQYRVAAGLSQEALAERAQMSSHGISALERGYRRTPQRGTLALLVGALALSDDQRRGFEEAAARCVLLRGGGRSSVTVGPWAAAGSLNLPFALTSFVGRETELAEIAALLRDHRLVTLTGAGGVGKTQTALRIATALSDADSTAVCFVGLASVGDPSLVAGAIASALGLQEVPNRPLLEILVGYLKNKTMLLILDNCEHVINEAAIVAETLLSGCPCVRIIATSREPLHAGGEHTYRLPSLRVPSPEAARCLNAVDATAYGAIVLFTDRARAVDPHFALTNENAPIIAEVCQRLDGIPLAIELAAARVTVLSVPNLAQRLDERFKILTGGRRSALPRHQTLSALIDWSYELLTSQEQLLFTRLGIFAGGFGLDAATSVCGGEDFDEAGVFDLLYSLTDKSLVFADTGGDQERFRLLESTAAYALEKLSASHQREVLARRHAEHFRNHAEAANNHFSMLTGVELNKYQVEVELGNYRLVLQWALTRGNDAVLGAVIAGALGGFWPNRAVEGRHWINLALERISKMEQPAVEARLRFALSWLSSGKRKNDEAERARQLYESVGDVRWAARVQRDLAFALMQTGRLDEAGQALALALTTSRKCGDKWNVATCIYGQGCFEVMRGEVCAARELIAQALSAFRTLGDDSGTAAALIGLAETEFADGHPERALHFANDALELHLRMESAMKITTNYGCRAVYCIALGDFTEARESALQALRWARQAQYEFWIAVALQHLAVLTGLRGDAQLAAHLLGYVGAQYSQLGIKLPPKEQWSYDKLEATLRETLPEEEIARLAAEGAAWSEDQAVEEALRV